MTTEGIFTQDYEAALDKNDICSHFDFTIEKGECKLPHANCVIAVFLAQLLEIEVDDTIEWPLF